MSDRNLVWISVAKYGLPQPVKNQLYIIYHADGGELGCGRYYYEYSIEDKKYLTDGKPRWFLDFDSVGHEEHILYYMEIELPEEYRGVSYK